MKRLEVVVSAAEEARGAALARRVEEFAPRPLRTHVQLAARLAAAVAATRPAALVVELSDGGDPTLAALEALGETRPPLLVCGPPDDAALVLRAMRLGARELVSASAEPDSFRAALERVLAGAKAALPEAGARGTVIGVLGAKGGVGTTFVAVQLAASLRSLAGSTALLDLAQPPGDVTLHLDLTATYSLARAAREAETLDATFLRSLLSAHGSGVQVLASTERSEDAELLGGATVERALALLRADFSWVVVDLGRGWSEGAVRALDSLDQLLVLAEAEVPCLVNARRQLDLLERLGFAAERVHLVENRQGGAAELSERDVKRFLGRAIEVRLPEDAAAARCANEGKTLAELTPYGDAQRALVTLARRVLAWCGQAEAEPARVGLLERVRFGLARRGHGTA